MTHSHFIVIEGLDGSGKSTQLALLDTYLSAQGIPFRHVHFPRLDCAPFGTLIAEFLRGDFGSLDTVHPKLVALLYAGDRYDFASAIRNWLSQGNLVIADRYVHSNIAFQCAKCTDAKSKAALKQWILDLEFAYYQIPLPDASFFLDVPVLQSSHAITADDTRTQRDIHESDMDFQAKVYHEYLDLTRSDATFHAVQCVDHEGTRLSPQTIHSALVQMLVDLDFISR